MRSSRWQPHVHTTAAVLLAVLMLAGGFCLFECDGGTSHDHGMPQSLCGVMIVVAVAPLALSRLSFRGVLVSENLPRPVAVPLSVLDPPPRPALV